MADITVKKKATLENIVTQYFSARGGYVWVEEAAMIRVMIVDDHSVVRLGLQMRLLLEKDIESVGEASTGEEALTLIQDASPDVVLMDVELPGMDGVETARVLRMVAPQSVIVILTIHDDLSTRTRAQAAG